jgi:hypothetical protein
MKTSAWTAAAASEVWQLVKMPREPGGNVRRTPGLSTKKRTPTNKCNIFTIEI